MIRGTKKAFRRMRLRRLMYTSVCALSAAGVLWGLVNMALAAPLHALAASTGLTMIAFARYDYILIHGRHEK